MPRKILMILTSTSQLGDTGQPTGVWLEELAAPYLAFVDAGHEVRLVSVKGRKAPLDPMSLGDPWLSASGKRFLDDASAMLALERTGAIGEVQSEPADALFLVGGAGCAYDFVAQPGITALVSRMAHDEKVVAGICHGVLGLAEARGADGTSWIRGRRITGISNAEEGAVGYDKVLPCLPEDVLRKAGALFEAAEPFAARTVRDGQLITGQNPASAEALGRAVVEALG